MLQVLEKKDFDQYINMAYEISSDLSRTSFPVYTDGVKTKEDFVRCLRKLICIGRVKENWKGCCQMQIFNRISC